MKFSGKYDSSLPNDWRRRFDSPLGLHCQQRFDVAKLMRAPRLLTIASRNRKYKTIDNS
jgi:hypothetical protein